MSQLLPGTVRQQDSLRAATEGRGVGRTFNGTQQAARIAEQKCTLTSPHGRQIEVPYALFEAFEDFKRQERPHRSGYAARWSGGSENTEGTEVIKGVADYPLTKIGR